LGSARARSVHEIATELNGNRNDLEVRLLFAT
jgi:hypothetical protein